MNNILLEISTLKNNINRSKNEPKTYKFRSFKRPVCLQKLRSFVLKILNIVRYQNTEQHHKDMSTLKNNTDLPFNEDYPTSQSYNLSQKA